jgi:hypothetical protein
MSDPSVSGGHVSTVPEPPANDGARPPRRWDPEPVGRDVEIVVGGLLLLGIVGGVLWWLLVSPAEFTRLRAGGVMSENELGKRFAADGVYVVIAAVAGLLSGLVLSWWRSRDPLLTSALLLLGSAVAAAAMAVTGHLLGPGDPGPALQAARIGARVPEQLSVSVSHDFSVYLVWPVAVLGGALLVLLGRAPEEDR